jgi:hypothetical protein
MKRPSEKSQGWLPTIKIPLWIFGVAIASIGLGGVSAVISSDLSGWSRSPLCGPSCLDEPIQQALIGEGDAAFKRYRAARQAAMKQLEISPFDTSAWLRITLLEAKLGGGMTPSAKDALLTSYKRAPVDAAVAGWRIPLTFGYWSDVGPEIRKAAIVEVRALYWPPQNRPRLRRMIREISSDNGGFAYWLLIEGLDDEFERPREGRETPTPTPRAKAQTPAIAGT